MMATLFDFLCLGLGIVFAWSAGMVLVGLVVPARRHPRAARRRRFVVIVCARNEEAVVRLPVSSALASGYPADCVEVVVLADNCTDGTAAEARAAGAEVWEKTTPSRCKGDVIAWGLERLLKRGGFDAIAVFDADNVVSPGWFDAMNDAFEDGETVVTGRRFASNAKANTISGWYAVYWAVMNELSNRVRTNLGLSGKITGTGYAFLPSALNGGGWSTRTLVEDVEFTVQSNLRGYRVAYVPEAEYADEQPVTMRHMWRQLCRWATGCWQVVSAYLAPWAKQLAHRPSVRLFDSYFAILTGISVAFVLLSDVLAFAVRLGLGVDVVATMRFFLSVLAFVFLMSWIMACASLALSPKRNRPTAMSVVAFPVFSLVLAATVLYALLRPTRRWKPIPHGAASPSAPGDGQDGTA